MLIAAMLLVSCGVRRNNPIAKGYHNMTSLFNGYYNGEQKYKEGVFQINQEFRVPAEGFIPVMYVGGEKEAQAHTQTFEEAITKAEVVLLKHDHKKNHWKDDCRFLIGRSWFYRRNYILAMQSFKYLVETFPDSKLIPDVYIWMVRTYYMDDNMPAAKKLLENELSKVELSKRQKGELALIEAEIYLNEGDLDEVLRTLEANKKYVRGKRNRARVHFLLGQIYDEKEQFSKSLESYRRVTRINTDYELIFNAKLRIARLYVDYQEGHDESKKISRLLRKMLRDEKNIEYRDRIYYEYALLDLKREDRPGAIEHLRESIRYNVGNQRQKALSYYKIGQIYFYDLKDFPKAQAYFDSASVAITTDAPEYREISMISKTLREYIGYVNTIELQDSLIQLSKLTDEQLKAHAEDILAEQRRLEEERLKAEMEELDRINDPNYFDNLNTGGNGGNRGNQGTGFYFDNPQLISSGKMEFQRLWGQRPNEDNWRRRQKDLIVAQAQNQDSVKLNPEDVEKYGAEVAALIANVPRTPAEVEAAHQAIAKALYGLGQVYQSKLEIADSAVAVYKRLIRRYPDNEYSLKARYALFKIFETLDPYLAEDYRDELCNKYPSSRYCKMARNEAVRDEEEEAASQFNSFYTGLFNAFDNKDYGGVLNFSKLIITKHPGHPKLAQVYYMRGLSFGYMEKTDSLRKTFEYIKKNYPEAEVTPEVIRTLSFMASNDGGSGPGEEEGPSGDDEEGPGEVTPAGKPEYNGFTQELVGGEKVYVVFMLDQTKVNRNELEQKVKAFNTRQYASSGLNTSIFLYNRQANLAYVSQFDSYRIAKRYIDKAAADPEINAMTSAAGGRILAITPTNFRVAFGNKRFDDYIVFFDEVIVPTLR